MYAAVIATSTPIDATTTPALVPGGKPRVLSLELPTIGPALLNGPPTLVVGSVVIVCMVEKVLGVAR